MNDRIKILLIGCSFLVVSLGLHGVHKTSAIPVYQVGAAQEPERLIEKLSWRSEPIRILKLKTNKKVIELGKKFSEGEDWIEGFSATVENISDKAIARIELRLYFPTSEGFSSKRPVWMEPITYGEDPIETTSPHELKLVPPGGTVELRLRDENVPYLYANLTRFGYSRVIKHVRIMVKAVTFVDGSTWSGDEMLYPDPDNPKQKFNPGRSPHKPSSRMPKYLDDHLTVSALTSLQFLSGGLKHAHAPGGSRRAFGQPLWTVQLPEEALRCDSIHLRTVTVDCGPVGEGCSYKREDFVENPTAEDFWQVNARKQLFQTTCRNSSGTQCSPNSIPINEKLPCGARVAGTCFAVANWVSYPSTGCITGLIFGGPCTRSATFQTRCADPTGYDQPSCSCPDGTTMSPVVIDVDHTGFAMTDAANGVVFNILNDGVPLQISWTAPGSTNALLVLDRNGNGTIDSGAELFGDITPQPSSTSPNGFLALAEYDKTANGGNGNGKIDGQDAVTSQLRLWQDTNHNGVSESAELKTLAQRGLSGIDLDFKESKRTDEFGNNFRYRAKVYAANGAHAGRWAWDVFVTVL